MKLDLGHAAAALGILAATLIPASAQEEQYSLELNAAQTVDSACRLTFVVNNASAQNIDASSFEMVTFGEGGGFASMSVFEFGTILAGRIKVVQFDLAGMTCEGLTRLVVNGAPQCTIAGAESDFCFAQLATANLTDVELLPVPAATP